MQFSLDRLISLIFAKLKYILIISVFVAVGAYFLVSNFVEKKYTSSAVLMIRMNYDSSQSTSNELSLTKQSVSNYVRILNTDNFFRYATEAINQELGTNYSYQKIKSNSSIKPGSSERASSDFSISFTSSSPEAAQKVLFVTTDKMIEYLESMNTSNPVDRIEDPSYPSSPSYPKTKNITLYAFLLTAIVLTALFIFIELLNDRVNNVVDITSNYDLTVLGVIPDYTPPKHPNKVKDFKHRSSTHKKEERNDV